MINLDKNENQYGPSEKCRKVMREITLETFNSYSRGFPKVIKNRLEKEFKIPPENIILGYGAEDILKQIFYFLLDEGDKVLLPRPSWWYYNAIAHEVEAETVYYNLKEKKYTFEFDVKEILKKIEEENPRIVLICTPNNPTGNSIDRGGLKKILKRTEDKDIIVIIDEAYWGFTGTGNKILELAMDYEHAIVLRTFSKFFALAGVRIGFGYAGSKAKKLIKFNSRYLGFNRISEELTYAALDSKDYYEKVAKKIEKERKRYFKELKKIGLRPYQSDANFILVRVPEKYIITLKHQLELEGVAIRFFDDEILNNCVRITIGTTDQNDIVIELFKEVVRNTERYPDVKEWK